MAPSGTYTFNPSIGELVLNAFARIGLRRAQLMQEHLVDARLEANLLLQSWSNVGVNLWEVDLQTETLVDGTATYTLAEETVTILDAYIQTTVGDVAIDRIIYPIGRSEYAAYPDKASTGFPTTFWFNRQVTPTITLWKPPDSAAAYTLKYYRMKALQDANLASGETLDVPDRFVDAFVAGLSHRLARIYKPEIEDRRKADAVEAWSTAAGADVENVAIHIAPNLSGYFR